MTARNRYYVVTNPKIWTDKLRWSPSGWELPPYGKSMVKPSAERLLRKLTKSLANGFALERVV